MPLTGHTRCTDRAAVLADRFHARRDREICELATAEVIDEFRADVEGKKPRSLALRQILNYQRMTPIEGRSFAYAAEPFATYFVGTLRGGRGVSPDIRDEHSYASENEAVFAVFVTRLRVMGSAVADGVTL
jgi:hypothetical protein